MIFGTLKLKRHLRLRKVEGVYPYPAQRSPVKYQIEITTKNNETHESSKTFAKDRLCLIGRNRGGDYRPPK